MSQTKPGEALFTPAASLFAAGAAAKLWQDQKKKQGSLQ
jgi:hypothetical protein